MASATQRNIRLGIFVITGLALLIIALYLIGSRQNLFGNSLRVFARFHDVSGLMQGNNVRYAGIDVGTVESVTIESDTVVLVSILLDKDVQKYLRKNAVAAVGTDGLMGNKLVNITSAREMADFIEEGDELRTQKPMEMDVMMRTLGETNDNIRVISGNLRDITNRLQRKNNLWNLLLDTAVADNVKMALVNLKLMSNDGIRITGDLRGLTRDLQSGKGVLGALITDTALSGKVKQIIVKLEAFSDTAAIISGDLSEVTGRLRRGEGSMGILLKDTMLVHDLNRTIRDIDTAANSFDQNMEALKYSWPFKKYYRKQKK